MYTAVIREVVQEMEMLPNDLQQQVLTFLQKLTHLKPRGVPGKQLLKFVGVIPAEDLKQMQAAIEENCATVDFNGWGATK